MSAFAEVLVVGEAESSEDLIRYMEGLTGRKLASRDSIHRYFSELWHEQAERNRRAEGRRIAWEGLLVIVLALAALHYYYWDVNLQIASLRSIQVFAAAPPASASTTGSFRQRAAP